jgi:hypothetical protein
MLDDDVLRKWSQRGDPLPALYTYETVKGALDDALRETNMRYKIYIQGSYPGQTNIVGDSDVDLVIALQDPFYAATSDLDPLQREKFYECYENSNATWGTFRKIVARHLNERFFIVSEGKCVTLRAEILTLDADVLVALDHRHYKKFFDYANHEFDAGVQFFSGDRAIVNHPKQHIANGNLKDWTTLGMFKPVVRIMKNARNALLKADSPSIEPATAPSYYVECLLWNVPDHRYLIHLDDPPAAYRRVIDWLSSCDPDWSWMRCQHDLRSLFGEAPDTSWSQRSAQRLTDALRIQLNDP